MIAAILEREPDWSALPAATPPRVRAAAAALPREGPEAAGCATSATRASASRDGTSASGRSPRPGGEELQCECSAAPATADGGRRCGVARDGRRVRISALPCCPAHPDSVCFASRRRDTIPGRFRNDGPGALAGWHADCACRAACGRPAADLDAPLPGEARPRPGTEQAASSVCARTKGPGLLRQAPAQAHRSCRAEPRCSFATCPKTTGRTARGEKPGRFYPRQWRSRRFFSASAAGGTPAPFPSRDRIAAPKSRVHGPGSCPTASGSSIPTRMQDGSGRLHHAPGEPGAAPRAILSLFPIPNGLTPTIWCSFARARCFGQRVDLASGRTVGEAFSIAEPVSYFFSTAIASFTTSRNGTLAIQSVRKPDAILMWVDRAGDRTSIRWARSVVLPAGSDLAGWKKVSLFDRREPRLGTGDMWVTDLVARRRNATHVRSWQRELSSHGCPMSNASRVQCRSRRTAASVSQGLADGQGRRVDAGRDVSGAAGYFARWPVVFAFERRTD